MHRLAPVVDTSTDEQCGPSSDDPVPAYMFDRRMAKRNQGGGHIIAYLVSDQLREVVVTRLW